MAVGSYGTIRPADVSPADVDIFYHYVSGRTASAEVQFEKLDQQQNQFEDRLDLDEEKLQQQRELQAQRLAVSMQSTAMKMNKPRGSGDR